MTERRVTAEALDGFVTPAQGVVDEYMGNPLGQVLEVEISRDRRYARVVKSTGGTYCLVEMSTGNIMRAAASGTAPLKGVRGNVYDEPRLAISPFGAVDARHTRNYCNG